MIGLEYAPPEAADVAEEVDDEEEDEYSDGASDLLTFVVFFANVGILISFVVSLLLLNAASNLGGAPMLFSMIMAIPVALLNARVFFRPPDDDEEEEDEGGSAAPYMILLAMVVIICIVYGVMTIHH